MLIIEGIVMGKTLVKKWLGTIVGFPILAALLAGGDATDSIEPVGRRICWQSVMTSVLIILWPKCKKSLHENMFSDIIPNC